MKVTIPTMDDLGLASVVCAHFGQTPFFVTVDTETDKVETMANDGQHHGEGRTPAEILVDAGAEAVVCSGMGRRAIQMFQDAGVQVFMGAAGTVQETLSALKEGKLVSATEDGACPGH